MSSIRFSLEKLDQLVNELDASVANVEGALQDFVPRESAPQLRDRNGNVVDVDFVARRLDRAIATVEELLEEGDF